MHILIDLVGRCADLASTQKRALEFVARASANGRVGWRLSILERQAPEALAAESSTAKGGSSPDIDALRAVTAQALQTTLPIALLRAPPRADGDPQSRTCEVRRLAALIAETGADLLITWGLSASALRAMDGGMRVLLFRGETEANPGAEPASQVSNNPHALSDAGLTVTPFPRSETEARSALEQALAAPAALHSPQRQARIQSASLAAFCAQAQQQHQREPEVNVGESATAAATAAGVDNRNALVFLLGPRLLYRKHLVSAREIVCGPDMETTFVDGRLATLNVPAGPHDLRKIINWLPAAQKPDLVVVKADATWRNLPTHLSAVKCPKVLLVGDTHHMAAPIRRVLSYAHSEPFDFVVIDHTRQHGHYFVESGFDRVAWLPAFDISPHAVPPPEAAARLDPSVVFVGQVGARHPYRTHVLETLAAAQVPVRVLRAAPADAARLYAGAAVSVNASLNGDLNLRVFEVLAARGCLLTDRLSPEAGLDDLLRDGEHASLYDSDDALVDRARALLADPTETRRMASAGHDLYLREHTPAARIAALTGWIDGGTLDARWNLQTDRRARAVQSVNRSDLNARLSAYETIQELHCHTATTSTLLHLVIWPDVDARLIVDLVDLPRLRLSVFGEAREIDPIAKRVLNEAGVWNQLHFLGSDEMGAPTESSTVPRIGALVLSCAAWMAFEPKALAQLAHGRRLIIATRTDAEAQMVLSRQPAFAAEGYLAAPSAAIPTFEQKNPVVLGEIAAMEGRMQDALECLQSALAADPEYVDALNNLGVLAQQTGDGETAASFLEMAIRLDRANVSALTNLSSLRRASDQMGEAEDLLLAAIAAAPNDPDLWQQLAQLRHERGNNLGARDAILRLGTLDPARAGMAEAIETLRAAEGHRRSPPPQTSTATDTAPASAAAGAPGAAGAASVTPPVARLRILLLNNIYPPQELGGYGRLMADFASFFEASGHTVHVLTSDTPYLGVIREPEASITRTLQLYGGWRNGRVDELPKDAAIARARQNHGTVKAVMESFQPDVAFIGNIDFVAPDIFAPLLNRGIPVLHYLANGNPGYSAADSPTSTLYRPIACSRWLATKISASHPLRDIGVIYPGARVSDYKMPLPPARRRLHIAYASLVMPYKGAHVLMGALEILASRHIDFSCTIAGHSTDANFLGQLVERAQAATLRGRVQFPGFLERAHLRALFARSNVLVFPSVFDEPFGISQVEALASGLTVVTSGTGGAAEIVEPEISGLVFPSEDSAALAESLIGLPADPARWQRLSEAGQARAFAHFDMRILALQLESELCTLAARGPQPQRAARKLPVASNGRPRI